jgi:hypothetical protein
MGDEMSKRKKFLFVTWVGPNVSVINRAKMSTDKAIIKDIISVSTRNTLVYSCSGRYLSFAHGLPQNIEKLQKLVSLSPSNCNPFLVYLFTSIECKQLYYFFTICLYTLPLYHLPYTLPLLVTKWTYLFIINSCRRF